MSAIKALSDSPSNDNSFGQDFASRVLRGRVHDLGNITGILQGDQASAQLGLVE